MAVMTVVQLVVMMQVGKSVYKGAMHGYVNGLQRGMEKGSADAKELVCLVLACVLHSHVCFICPGLAYLPLYSSSILLPL